MSDNQIISFLSPAIIQAFAEAGRSDDLANMLSVLGERYTLNQLLAEELGMLTAAEKEGVSNSREALALLSASAAIPWFSRY